MAFFYENNRLKIGTPDASADVESLARSRTAGPVYIYDLDDVERRFQAMNKALGDVRHTIHYAMKANSHPAILAKFASLGAGADTVSGGEIKRALEAGIPASRIIFSGVAKTVAEIEFALKNKIKQINVESPQELERIAEVAERLGSRADVAFRLNPDVNPQTHPYITTGFRENKFGMDESFMPELVAILKSHSDHLKLRGLTMHIGSLLFDLGVFREAITKTIAIHRQFVAQGFPLDRLDIGGGLGIRYETEDASSEFSMMQAYGTMVRELIKDLNVELLTEPGRILVARAGLLVGEVQYIKPTTNKTFAILDTGMHHLLRPALYSAKHRVLPVVAGVGKPNRYDIVGPICESSDFLAKDVELAPLKAGDLVAMADAGAYGFSMASRYNSHDLPQEIVVSQAKPL